MRPAHLSEAGQCIEHGPGQDRPSFDARPAPRLPADHLRRHADTLCRRSTRAALPRVFVDSTLSAAAGMMPVHARLAAGQLCDCAMASKQATPMAEHCGAVHPRGDGRPSIRPSRAHDGRAPRRLRATSSFVACHDTNWGHELQVRQLCVLARHVSSSRGPPSLVAAGSRREPIRYGERVAAED